MIVAVTAIVALSVLLFLEHWLHARERQAHREQIDRLLQRIQAPEVAVMDAVHYEGDLPQPPPWDDDNAMFEAMREMRDGAT